MPEVLGPQKMLHSLGAVVPKAQLSQGCFLCPTLAFEISLTQLSR